MQHKFKYGEPEHFHTGHWSKFTPPPAKTGSGTVLVCFSQLSLYPKTKPRLGHPLPEEKGLVSSKPDRKLPDSKLFFSAESLTENRTTTKLSSARRPKPCQPLPEDRDLDLTCRKPGNECDRLVFTRNPIAE